MSSYGNGKNKNGNGNKSGNGKSSKKDEECCPCEDSGGDAKPFLKMVGEDPRFQQQNQTLRCYVSYRDFYRCERILGEGHQACEWFQDVFNEYCPTSWIETWDEQRAKKVFPGYMKDPKR